MHYWLPGSSGALAQTTCTNLRQRNILWPRLAVVLLGKNEFVAVLGSSWACGVQLLVLSSGGPETEDCCCMLKASIKENAMPFLLSAQDVLHLSLLLHLCLQRLLHVAVLRSSFYLRASLQDRYE